MSSHEREGLITRIRQMRRAVEPTPRPRPSVARSDADLLAALEERVTHIERMMQGLQDSVHRESKRQGERIAELEARIHPAAVAKALSRDARERGL